MTDTLQRTARPGLAILCTALVLLLAPRSASAQLPFGQQRATAIENARVLNGMGGVFENATILIQGGRVARVGAEVEVPGNARTIDADGRTVTAGLIDAHGALGLTPATGSAVVRARAADAFDPYAGADFRDALRNGVTTMYLPARGGAGVTGIGAIVRLKDNEDGGTGEIVSDEAALCIDLGSGASPSDRLSEFQELRQRFQAALDYRESLEIYEEELDEYVKKVKERAKKKEEEKESDEPEGEPGEEPEDKPAPGEDEPTPDEEPGDEGDEPAPEDEPQPEPEPEDGAFALADDGDEADGDAKDEKKKDDLERPTRPTPDRDAEVLLKVLDREFPARIVAHRSADILNALELADEFVIDVIIEGATEAYLVADELAEAEAPVVLSPMIGSGTFSSDEYQRRVDWNARTLERAGVEWYVGSGARDGLATRFVLLQAQMASQHTDRDPVRIATADAASLLGIEARAGRIMPGLPADLVIWDGDPLDAGVPAWIVLVDGEPAYRGRTRRGGN